MICDDLSPWLLHNCCLEDWKPFDFRSLTHIDELLLHMISIVSMAFIKAIDLTSPSCLCTFLKALTQVSMRNLSVTDILRTDAKFLSCPSYLNILCIYSIMFSISDPVSETLCSNLAVSGTLPWKPKWHFCTNVFMIRAPEHIYRLQTKERLLLYCYWFLRNFKFWSFKIELFFTK